MLKPGEVIEIDMRKLFMDDFLWVRVTFIKYWSKEENHPTLQPWMRNADLMLVEGEDGKQFVWSTHLRRYPLKVDR